MAILRLRAACVMLNQHEKIAVKKKTPKMNTFKKKLGQLLVCNKLFDWGNATFYDFASGITFLEYSLRMVEPPLWMSKSKYISIYGGCPLLCWIHGILYIEYLL